MLEIDVLRWVIEIPLLGYALYRGAGEVREYASDHLGKFGKQKYRVKRTIIKNLIQDDRLETTKIRMIRAHSQLDSLTLDAVPTEEKTGRRFPIASHYSIPGRAIIDDTYKFHIILQKAQELAAHKDHAILLGYTALGTMKDFFDPPGIVVEQPVGKESLVVEAYFPSKLRYQRKADRTPNIEVYTLKPGEPVNPGESANPTKMEVSQRQLMIAGGDFDFQDGRGMTDWFRVTITKPPQDLDIYVDWFWDQTTTKDPQGSAH